jgi:hypothetical protein
VRQDATGQVDSAVDAISGIARAKGELVTKILFETLKPEQRKPALACMVALKLLHKGLEHDEQFID